MAFSGINRFSGISAKVGVGLVVGAVAASVGAFATAASAGPVYSFYASMGGSKVDVVGSTVNSGLTAQSSIQGVTLPTSKSNTVANVNANGLLSVGAITTAEQASKTATGATVVGTGHTAGVSLLGGLISIQGVTTRTTTTISNGVASGTGSTQFVGLHIPGVNLPVNVPPNYTVTIPGIATLILNGVYSSKTAHGALVQTFALDLTLLNPHGSSPIGSEITLNPGEVAIANSSSSGNYNLGGFAYGTKIDASVPGVAQTQSGMTGEVIMPSGGTQGKTETNSTAAINVPQILQVGTIGGSQVGTTSTSVADVQDGYELAGLNVLNGLVKASAIKGTAQVHRNIDGSLVPRASTTFVNLTIAGRQIPITVSPNTVVNVAGVATITLNQQVVLANTAAVRGIDIKLTVARYGLPVGAEIEIGAAAAYIVAV